MTQRRSRNRRATDVPQKKDRVHVQPLKSSHILKGRYIFIGLSLIICLALGAFVFLNREDYEQPARSSGISGQTIPPQSSLTRIKHVFVIVEENHNWADIYKNPEAPYINTVLLKRGGYALDYHNFPPDLGVLHPSEPNYILLEAGTNIFPDHTFATDNDPSSANSTASTNHLTTLLEKQGYTWRAYAEGITGTNCPTVSYGNYAAKHVPFVYFQNVSGNPPHTNNTTCREHIRPLTELSDDLKLGNIANYTFITPNIMHDMHNGTIQQGDAWLARVVPQILATKIFQKDGALFITWDEGDDNNPIGLLVLSPFAKKGYVGTNTASHVSLLKTVEEIFKLMPLLGYAGDKTTNDLSDFFKKYK